MTRPFVVVTDGVPDSQARSTLAAVRALAAAGHRVAVTTSGRHDLAAASRAVTVAVHTPPVDDPTYRDAVHDIAAELDAVTVLPASDAALLALGLPGADLVDKDLLAARVEAAGLPALPGQFFTDGSEMAAAGAELELPLVVKVARKQGRWTPPAAVVRAPADLVDWATFSGPVRIEPYVDAPMHAVFGVIHRGDLLALGAQRYLRTWPPTAGTSSAAVTCPLPDDVTEDHLRRLLDGYDGIFQVQFVGPHAIDVNPRVYGSLPLAVLAGVNLPAIWCSVQSGEPVAAARARHGVRYRWLEGEVRWGLRALRDGDLAGALAAWRPRPGAAGSVWALHDAAPMARRLAHAIRCRHSNAVTRQPRRPAHPDPAILGLTDREAQLLASLPTDEFPEHGVPTRDTAARRDRARQLLRDLDTATNGDGKVLPLTWSSDIDAGPAVRGLDGGEHLRSLDPLLARLGTRARDQWLVVERGRGLTRLDLAAAPDGDPLMKAVARSRANRRVRFREVVELRRLREAGVDLPDHPVVAEAAHMEARLGGACLAGAAGLHRVGRQWLRRRPHRPRRRRALVIAFSGLDGAGKSTQVSRLAASLEAAGLPVTVVWTRPGMHLDWLKAPRRLLKRLLGMSSEAGVAQVGSGDGAMLRSRQGLLGRAWRVAVVLSYVLAAWRPRVGRDGIVIYDRHLLDAAATLQAVYLAEPTGWLGRALRWLLPRADMSILLDVPAAVAAARKPDEVFSSRLLDAQAAVYTDHRDLVGGLHAVDGTRPTDEIADEVLSHVLGT